METKEEYSRREYAPSFKAKRLMICIVRAPQPIIAVPEKSYGGSYMTCSNRV